MIKGIVQGNWVMSFALKIYTNDCVDFAKNRKGEKRESGKAQRCKRKKYEKLLILMIKKQRENA